MKRGHLLALALAALGILASQSAAPVAGQITSPPVWARGEDGVWRSDDGGETWQLKRADACYLGGYGTGTGALAVVSDSEVYVSGCDDYIWRTEDGGATWQRDTPEPLRVNLVGQAEASSDGVVLVVPDGGLDNQLWRRDPSTGAWSVALTGAADEDFYAPTILGQVAYLLATQGPYGAYHNRVYKSWDAGLNWIILVDQVAGSQDWWAEDALAVGRDTLYIADTFEGLWVLQDATLRGPYPFYPSPEARDVTALAWRRHGGLYVGGKDTCEDSQWPVRGFLYDSFFDLTSQVAPQPINCDYVYSLAEGGDLGSFSFLVDYDTFHDRPGQNLYRSADGGLTWTTVNPPGEDYVAAVAVAAPRPEGLYPFHMDGYSYDGSETNCADPDKWKDPITVAFVYGGIPATVQTHAEHHGYPYSSGGDQNFYDHGWCRPEHVDRGNEPDGPLQSRFHMRARTGTSPANDNQLAVDAEWGVFAVGTPHYDEAVPIPGCGHKVPENYNGIEGYSGFDAGKDDIIRRWVADGAPHNLLDVRQWFNTAAIKQQCSNPLDPDMPSSDGWVYYIAMGDTDGDGCSDQEELGANKLLGGQRDPLNPYDFYDITNITLAVGAKDKGISGFDLNLLLQWGGTRDNGPPNSNGKDYDDDSNANTVDDGREMDFAGLAGPHTGPDGGISGFDLNDLVSQAGGNCQAPP